jgi:transposase InsO family protein
MDAWAYQYRVQLDFIRPGRPMENGSIESFNDRLRDECLNVNVFFTHPWQTLTREARAVERGLQLGPAAQQSGRFLAPAEYAKPATGPVRLSKLRDPRPAPCSTRPTWGKTSTPDSTHKRAYVGRAK